MSQNNGRGLGLDIVRTLLEENKRFGQDGYMLDALRIHMAPA
jgi:hypothetical protein